MTSIFSRAKAIGEKIERGAGDLLVKVFGQAAVKNVESQLETIFRSDIIVIFQDAVTAAESLQINGSPATGAQKRDAAFQQLEKDLATNGISLAENAINLGIELVVGLLKTGAPIAAV